MDEPGLPTGGEDRTASSGKTPERHDRETAEMATVAAATPHLVERPIALAAAGRIESGIGRRANGPAVRDKAQMPLGGIRDFGDARFGGKAGIAEFMELRWIMVQDGPLHHPF